MNESKTFANRVHRVLSRFWNREDQSQSLTAVPVRMRQPQQRHDVLPASALARPPSKTTSTILEKVRNLKIALEFDGDERSRLDRIISTREFLLYLDEVILFKFMSLKKSGLLDSQSSLTIESVSHKLKTFLLKPMLDESENEEELKRSEHEGPLNTEENDHRQSRVVSGVITEREIELEKECEILRRKITRLDAAVRTARIKLKALNPMYDMVDTLRAKNSILNDKVRYQSKLLRTLSKNQPDQEQLLATSQQLKAHNINLRSKLQEQSTLVDQLSARISSGDPSNMSDSQLKDLMDQHIDLYKLLN